MDILTIGEVLIDLTQTGKDARGIPQFAAPRRPTPRQRGAAFIRSGTAQDSENIKRKFFRKKG